MIKMRRFKDPGERPVDEPSEVGGVDACRGERFFHGSCLFPEGGEAVLAAAVPFL